MEITLYNIAWYFVLYSFLGWCLEEVFCTINTGQLVNRGFLNGPVCPIYGFGMVLVLLVLGGIADNVLLLFFGGMLLTSALELGGGWALKRLCHTTWWDYSDQPFNIGGYVCLKFSLAWGLGCVVAVRGIHPVVASAVRWLHTLPGFILLCVCLVCFVVDLLVTVLTIRKLNMHLGVLSDVAKALHNNSEALSNGLGKLALAADEKLDAGKETLTEKAAAGKEVLTDKLEDAQAAAEQMRAAWTQRTTKLQKRIQGRLLKAYPAMRSERNNEALSSVRAWYLEHKKK